MSNLSSIYSGRLFSLEFVDADKFRVVHAELNAGDLIETVGDDGKPVRHQFVVRVPVAAEDWSEALWLNATWTRQTSDAVIAWKKANPSDTKSRQEVAAAERGEFLTLVREIQKELEMQKAIDATPDVAAPPPDQPDAEEPDTQN